MRSDHIMQALQDPEIVALIEAKLGDIEVTPDVAGPSLDEIMSLTAFAQRYPDLFTAAQLRWKHFNADTCGWAEYGVSFKIGKRVYINVPAFRRWMLTHTN